MDRQEDNNRRRYCTEGYGTLHKVRDDNSAAGRSPQRFRDPAHSSKVQPCKCGSLCISTSERNNSSWRPSQTRSVDINPRVFLLG
jgi:hypothetical protein